MELPSTLTMPFHYSILNGVALNINYVHYQWIQSVGSIHEVNHLTSGLFTASAMCTH